MRSSSSVLASPLNGFIYPQILTRCRGGSKTQGGGGSQRSGGKAEEERRMNERIALEEERSEKERWLVEEQIRHVQEELKMRMKAEQKRFQEKRYKRMKDANSIVKWT
ncbi:hypothetical protein TNCV_3359671 [Trichonephila clavipes]|nr:hypothetical protein TNCV_3359671 [Trichonephila clavipes]